jgi:dipeptidyl aminopeptidase/acylaminoacyl peptidase
LDNRTGASRGAENVVSGVLRLTFALAFFLSMESISSAQSSGAVRVSKESFESGGKKIAVEIYSPPETAPNGAGILVLHGAGGMLMDGPAIRRFARALAQNGFESFVVHYFDRTGSLFARDASIHKNFDTWRATVNDAVDYIASRPEVKRIGCFGYSLGAYLSLAQAAHDPRIAAVVELAGAIDKEHAGLVKRLPPILILHGEQDRRVSSENALRLEKVLLRLGVAHEMKIYSGEGHVLSTALQRDAAMRAVHFLREHLR